MLFVLCIVALIVGILIGTVGVGGILLIPAMAALAQISTHASMATSLFSFIFTGIIGTWIYQRHGSINWKITIPVCAGSVIFGYLGAIVNAYANATVLNIILSFIIIFAGVYALRPYSGDRCFEVEPGNRKHLLMLLAIGSVVGFGSGLTGVGGPVLSVPIMVVIGFNPLTAIATSQVIQITAAVSGSASNFANGFIDFQVASWVTVVELVGVMIGAKIAHKAKMHQLRNFVAAVCIVVGGFILVKSIDLPGIVSARLTSPF